MAKTPKTPDVAAPAPAEPMTFPEVDGGGDPEHLIYVERHDGLIPYLARSDRRHVVWIDGAEYQHVSEHEGRWVYRRS